MLIEQTLFDPDGQPLGKAVQDGISHKVQFIPHGSDEPLSTIWLSVEACRRAVLAEQEAACSRAACSRAV